VAVNTQFSIAVHIMAALGYTREANVTSTRLARSVNTSPSFVRRILAKLSKAGLVLTATGKNGACWLARKPTDISLLDIYQAVEAPKAFSIHGYATQRPCVVSCNIKSSLGRVLAKTQTAMEASLKKISLAEIVSDLKRK
jgi:Rrf2 family protein